MLRTAIILTLGSGSSGDNDVSLMIGLAWSDVGCKGSDNFLSKQGFNSGSGPKSMPRQARFSKPWSLSSSVGPKICKLWLRLRLGGVKGDEFSRTE